MTFKVGNLQDNDPLGFDYAMGFFLRFSSESQHAELRCYIFSQFSSQSQSFILVCSSSSSDAQLKGRKDIRFAFLDWLRQLYDLYIDTSAKRFSSFQLTNLCNGSYELYHEPPSDPESRILLTYSLPSLISGIRKMHLSIPTSDVHKMASASPLSLVDISLSQLHYTLTLDADILLLEQFATQNLIANRNGRLKFIEPSSVNDLLLLLSPVSNKHSKRSRRPRSSPPGSGGTSPSTGPRRRG